MKRALILLLFLLGGCAPLLWAQSLEPDRIALREIRGYVKGSWVTLQRSNADLLRSANDPKLGPENQHLTLYVARDEDVNRIKTELQGELARSDWNRVSVRSLPADVSTIQEHGLLYLPHPYIVPGGRFNEMYGWDSYFILLGLVNDGELALAKAMTDNFIYQIEHYGMILNANRTYYLTRSQPPFLTRMILEVYSRTGDTHWLANTVPAIEKYYRYWTTGPHLVEKTGLSRYYGGADTPAPEVVEGERDEDGKNHYDRVREYYRTHDVKEYGVSEYYDKAHDQLTPQFFLGDRAMRESGFDPSSRFGPFSVDIINYNPVCLNSLLYRMEMDCAAILTILDRPRDAALWTERARKRSDMINNLMWDENSGLYCDYKFNIESGDNTQEGKRSDYHFVTTFYPLWAGIATPDRARRVAENLGLFEKAWGLQTSDRETGNQWDAPFGWAPMQIIAAEGLRRYGFTDAADRIQHKFLNLVLTDFQKHNAIKEKYNVVTGTSDLRGDVRFGYTTNEIGFGWTNAAVVLFSPEITASLMR